MSKLRGIKLQYMSFCLAVFVIFSTFFLCFLTVDADELSPYAGDGFRESVNDSSVYHSPFYFKYNLAHLADNLPSLEQGRFYRFDYVYDYNFSPVDTDVTIDALSLNLVVKDNDFFDTYNFCLYQSSSTSSPQFMNNFNFHGEGFFIVPAFYYDPTSFQVSIALYKGNYSAGFSGIHDFWLEVTDVTALNRSEGDIYQSAYDSGYTDGEDHGYINGRNEGYDVGYIAGQESIDTDLIYQQGYQDGLLAGSGSVDLESVYQNGYSAGYNAGYSKAYDEGYLAGYSEALTTLDVNNKTSFEAGESQFYSFTDSVSSGYLDHHDANTPFSSFVYSTGFNGDIAGSVDYEGHVFDDGDLWLYGDNIGDFVSESYYYGSSYNIGSVNSLFRTSPDVYAYKIFIKPKSVNLTKDAVTWVRPMIGTYSDVLACNGQFGHDFVDGSTQGSTIWLVTDYSDIYICLGYLSFYELDWDYTASYSLDWSFDIEAVPYTKNEYNSATAAIEKQTIELQKQMDDLKHGFDSSSGDSLNDDFSASLTDYQTSENSLFNEAQSGLENFTFVDFSSYPALVTAMTFTTSMMNSLYGAMGGETGPFGIVLSVLFSVMLVSMAIGLYRFYQDKKDGGG